MEPILAATWQTWKAETLLEVTVSALQFALLHGRFARPEASAIRGCLKKIRTLNPRCFVIEEVACQRATFFVCVLCPSFHAMQQMKYTLDGNSQQVST